MRKKLTKLMAVALALVMVAALVPAIGLAEEGTVKYSDGHDWVTVAGANKVQLDDAGNVKLLENIEINTFIQLQSGSVTVDLNGHTLKRTGETGNVLWVEQGAKLTLTGSGTITGTKGNATIIVTGNNSKLVTAEGSKITVTQAADATDSVIKAQNGAALELNNATVISTGASTEAAARCAVSAIQKGTSLTINGGSYKGKSPVISASDASNESTSGAPTVTIKGGAKIEATDNAKLSGVAFSDGAVATLEDCEISGDVGVFGTSELTIKAGAKINHETGFAVSTNGAKSKGAKITIEGGTITGADNACGVYLPAGELTIKHGDISGGAGIVARYGSTLTVEGGTITATAASSTELKIGDGSEDNKKVTPAAVVVNDKDNTADRDFNVTIEGGNFVAPEEVPTVSYQGSQNADNKSPAAKEAITVTGGDFKSGTKGDNGENGVRALLPQGNAINETTGEIEAGTNAVAKIGDVGYETLKDAIDNAPAGATIVLQKDVDLPGNAQGTDRIEITKKITIDLNGKTLSKSEQLEEKYAGLKVVTKGDLTITDTKGTGKVTGKGVLIGTFEQGSKLTLKGCTIEQTEGTPEGNEVAIDAINGTVNVEDGTTIKAAESALGVTGSSGTINVNGGEINAGIYGVATNGSANTKNATVNVTGGKITGGYAGMYLPSQGGTTTVKGDAYIEGTDGAGVVVRGGTITVSEDEKGNAPTIVAKGDANKTYGDDKTHQLPPAAVVMDTQTGYGSATKGATLKAGEFKAEAGQDAVVLTNGNEAQTSGNELDVQGGYYSKEVNKNFLADNVNTEAQTTDGEYGYFSSAVNVDEQMEQDGKTLKENTISILEGKAAFVAAGFIGTGTSQEDANKIINDAIKKAFPDATKKIEDSCENVFWAIFQASEPGEYKVKFSFAGKEYEESVTINQGNKGGIVYFTGAKGTIPATGFQGEYAVTLSKEQKELSNATIEVYQVSYEADPKTVSGTHTPVYTDWDGLDAALKAQPDGFEFANGTSMWKENVVTPEKANDVYAYTVTLSAYTYVAPPMPGTPTGPDNPDNPDNPPVVDPAKKFVDVPDVAANKWYRDALNYVLTTKPGVIEGTDGTHFSPNAKLTRAAFAKILWALDGKETATAANPFTDVKSGDWFYDAVIWANAEGIMLGDAGRCKPEDNITREEMAVMIQRWLNGKAATTASKFTDAKDIHDWAAGAVNWAAEQGYIKGKDDGSFAPLASLTRAEMIVVVARTLGWIG